MAYAAFPGDLGPLTLETHERLADFGVELGVHRAPNLAKFCYARKQPIASSRADDSEVNTSTSDKPVNQVIADNLAYFMEKRGVNQPQLAARSGVSQTAISLYLNPERRMPSKSGKPPSAKVTELAQLAAALDVGVWELMRPMTEREREFYRSIEVAYRTLKEGGYDT